MARRSALVLLGLLALALPGVSRAQTCPDGTYLVDGPPIFPTPLAVRDAIVIREGSVAILSGCPAVPARLEQTPEETWLLQASWRRCENARRVSLKAKIDAGCRAMQGVVEARRPRLLRRFIARADAPCLRNEDCPATSFCAKPPGSCTGPGSCRQRPDACPDVWLPVCGCDGRTYSNACDAAAAGVSVASEGACERRCNASHPCPSGQYCELPTGVCANDTAIGLCVAVPEICPNDFCGNCEGLICPLCPNIYQPVCGCDGVTYATDCERRKAQVSKAYDGECRCPLILCAPGTEPVDRDGDGCAETCLAPCDSVCDCKVNPDISLGGDCPLLCPTCGPYWSCEAGYCVEQCGPVPPDECRLCGGIAGLPCPDGSVCDLPAGQCSSADLFGICKPSSGFCPQVWDPVCGCDGKTYSNDCVRLAAGVQKAYDGECRP